MVIIYEPCLNKSKIRVLRIRDFKLLRSVVYDEYRSSIISIFLLGEYSSDNMVVISLEVDNSQYWIT